MPGIRFRESPVLLPSTPGRCRPRSTYNGLNGLSGIPANTAAGVTLLNIQQVGSQVEFQALTRYQDVTLQSAGLGASGSVFTVDGVASVTTSLLFMSAPFQGHALEAGGGGSQRFRVPGRLPGVE